MKKLWMVMVPMLALGTALHAENGDPGGTQVPLIDVANNITTSQSQDVSVSSTGGNSDSTSNSNSNANVNINTTSNSNYETRTPPLTSFPPYLPYWNHGGWGTVKAYFPNGPTMNDQVYETTFDPDNPEDMHEVRSVLCAMPHAGVLEAVGGVLNGLAVALFDAPDRYFAGRGVQITNSIVRDRRPEGKPLLVFIDSNVDMNLLAEQGYAYVGKVSIEGDVERNWDQAYKTAVAEALLWDTDILLLSGGMKGVTVGQNVTFPSAAAGYSQANYSLSLFGAKATGITEGKGKAILSADAYRFDPGQVERRRIPASVYDRIRYRPEGVVTEPGVEPLPEEPPAKSAPEEPSGKLAPEKPAGVELSQMPCSPQITQETCNVQLSKEPVPPPVAKERPSKPRPAARVQPKRGVGITISRELYEMAGFARDQQVSGIQLR